MSKNVVFDFDGVIHSYKSGWQGVTEIPDPPVKGIKEAILSIREAGYRVFVVSSRCSTSIGISAVQDWLTKYGIYVDGVVCEKPPAVAYIDDRAICFDGDTKNLLKKIEEFKPWYERQSAVVVGDYHIGEVGDESVKKFIINTDIENSIRQMTRLIDNLTIAASDCPHIKDKERYIKMIQDSVDILQDLIDSQESYKELYAEET